MKNKIRFGIIGCSRIAQSSTIPAILQSEFAELEMIGSSSEEKAKKFAEEFNCKKFGSYYEVLENNEVDAVYISVPIGLHEEWTIKAAKSGKHILCEKSSSSSYESAKRMVACSKQNNVRIMEGFMFRFHPSHRKVHELINSGYLGTIFSFYGQYGFPPIPHEDIRFKKELGGGVLNDAGCYPICASRIIFGKEPIGVTCHLTIDSESGVDTKATIFLKYGDQKFANMVVGYDLFYQSMYSIWGSEGFLRLSRAYNIPPDMKASLIVNSPIKNQEILIKSHNHFKLMIDNFVKEIIHPTSAAFNFEDDLLKQAKVMEAARLSHKKQSFILIKNIK